MDDACERFYSSEFSYDILCFHSHPYILTKKDEKHGNIAAKRIENHKIRKRELEIIAGIKPHKNLVRIYGLLYEKPYPEAIGYVMEHMYASLEEVIDAQSSQATDNLKKLPHYSYEKSLEIAVEICNGITFLHEANIIHRDIKPSNVLVSNDLAQVKLCDYGVSARYVENRSLTVAQGTFIYMAPELGVMASRTRYTASCDVYSTAITLYELLQKRRAYAEDIQNEDTGNLGFLIFMEVRNGKRPTFHDTTVCPTAKNIIEKCWRDEPMQRPSIVVVRSELKLILRLLHHNRVETLQQQELKDKTENLPIESFLGEFTADENTPLSVLLFESGKQIPVRTIFLRKSFLEDYFEFCFKFNNGKEMVSLPWIPDNIERNKSRYRIEKNVLICVYNKAEDRFVFQDNGLTFNGGFLYTRRDVNHEDKWSVTKINNRTTKNMPIEAFLGEFAAGEEESRGLGIFETERLPIHKVIIEKANQEGYFEIVWKSDSEKECVSLSWKPDNVERNGLRYRIEKNILIFFYKQSLTYYELTDQGLKMDGNFLYTRV